MNPLKLLVLFSVFALPATALAAPCTGANSITKVQNRKVGAREYVDFFVKAPFSGTLSVTAATSGKFIEDGSGDTIMVGGNTWTDVLFTGMNWTCEISNAFALPKTIIKDIKSVGQFEGHIEYAIGRRNGHYLGQSTTTVGKLKRITLKYGP